MWIAVAACLWVIAASVVAFLPMRRQYAPGFALLLAAPVLIGALAWNFGWYFGVIGLLAFVSMFRRPLWFIGRRLLGLEARAPAKDTKP